MQFIGWVAPYCVRADVVLDGIVGKLQCPMFYVKRTMNRVPDCAITLILGNKWSLVLLCTFWYGYFKKR